MNIQELATVVQEKLPIKIAVVNNGFLGMVRQWQDLFYQGRLSESEILGPDLVPLAGAYGIQAWRVTEADELESTLDQAEALEGPCLLDLRIPAQENVFPMASPGTGIENQVPDPALDPAR